MLCYTETLLCHPILRLGQLTMVEYSGLENCFAIIVLWLRQLSKAIIVPLGAKNP